MSVKVTVLSGPNALPLTNSLASGGDRLFAFGGTDLKQTRDLKKFVLTEMELAVQAVFADGGEVWAGGTALARSTDGGTTFAPVTLPTTVAKLMGGIGGGIHAIAREGNGSIWLGGANGLLLCGTGGKFARVKALSKETVTRAVSTADGAVLITSNRGRVYTCAKRKATAARLATKGPLDGIAVTPRGTVVVVGDGTPLGPGAKSRSAVAFRSDDGGRTFKLAKVPKVPPFTSLACLPDGRLVAGGRADGVFVSNDDGATFTAVSHGIKNDRDFNSAVTHRGAVLLCGPGQALLRVE